MASDSSVGGGGYCRLAAPSDCKRLALDCLPLPPQMVTGSVREILHKIGTIQEKTSLCLQKPLGIQGRALGGAMMSNQILTRPINSGESEKEEKKYDWQQR